MYQSITIAGNLGRDPEMRYTPSGQAVTNLNVATNRSYTKNDEKIKETTWFRVSVWGKQAESCNQYLRKGSKVLVEGRMNADPATGGPRIWGEPGNQKASFEITAQSVTFLSSKTEDQGTQQGGSGYGTPNDAMTPPADDDIPF